MQPIRRKNGIDLVVSLFLVQVVPSTTLYMFLWKPLSFSQFFQLELLFLTFLNLFSLVFVSFLTLYVNDSISVLQHNISHPLTPPL
jgi:hypothetical protein